MSANPWKNRIVGTALVDPRTLIPHEFNFRRHPKHQAAALAGAIDEIGYIKSVLVSKRTNKLLDGHLRIEEALRQKQETIPVEYVDLSPEEELVALASIDPIVSLAKAEKDTLESLLGAIKVQDQGLQAMLAGLAKENNILIGNVLGATEDDAPVERAVELLTKWQVKSGDLWVAPSKVGQGEHRLLCGDSANADTVVRAMGGHKATCVFTDPPFGVSIAAKNRLLNTVQKAGRCLADITDDDLSPEQLKERLLPAFVNLRTIVMAEDCTVFVSAPQGGELGMMMMTMMAEAGLRPRHVLIWKKNSPTFSMGRLDYDYQHEPVLLTWGARHKRPMLGQHRTSVWEIDKPRKSAEHPTMKPVALYANAYLNNSDQGDHVADLYAGSGTAFAAAEQLGRICHGIELEPKYVAVCLERLALLGLEPGREH